MRKGLVWTVVLFLAPWPASAVPPIVQLPGAAGCVTESGTFGACADGVALNLPRRVAVSPDGRNVYVGTELSDAVVIFDRNLVTGALTQKPGTAGCISEDGTAGACVNGVALDGAVDVTVSPDGRSVYVAAAVSDAVVIYDRNLETGALSFKVDVEGCVSDDGTGMECQDGVALSTPLAVAVSPDGRNVYVASTSSNAIAVFDRDPTGELTQKGGMQACISEGGAFGCAPGVAFDGASAVAVSPDGENVYAIGQVADSVLILDRNIDTGVLTQKVGIDGCVSEDGTMLDCVNGVALGFTNDSRPALVVSPDGKNVYVVSNASDAVAVFDRDLLDGGLTQKAGLAGCISLDGTGNQCTQGIALDDPLAIAVSPDGRSVYVASHIASAVAVFDRDVSTGALTQKAGVSACVSESGSSGACVDGLALSSVNGVAVSGDGRHLYGTSAISDGVVTFDRVVPPYDIDGDGESDPLTDGLLLLRHRFGFTGGSLIAGAVDLDCTRCTAPVIEAYIAALLAP